VTLQELFDRSNFRLKAEATGDASGGFRLQAEVTGVAYDSRQVKPGAVFFALNLTLIAAS